MKGVRTWLLAVLLACPTVSTGVREGELAPAFEAPDLAGHPVELAELRGKPALLVFWASWCQPCLTKVPELNGIAAFYGDGLTVLGLNQRESVAEALAAAQRTGMTYRNLVDPAGAIGTTYQVSSIPLVLVLDAEGRIRYRGNGLPSHLLQLLDSLGAQGG